MILHKVFLLTILKQKEGGCGLVCNIKFFILIAIFSFSLTDSALSSPCHGVVTWMEYQLLADDVSLLSEGLLQPPCKGSELVWSSGHNEGISFFMDHNKTNINYSISYFIKNGQMSFKFY